MLTGLISFLAVIVGASLQYLFTRHIENKRHLRELRSKSYMDYLRCVSEQAQLRPKDGTQEKKELFAKTGDAKARICLYGSVKVIEAFSAFEKLGASMGDSNSRLAFTNMVSVMRIDSGGDLGVSTKDLENILLGYYE